MRHRKKGRKLSRIRKTRSGLIKTILGSVFLHEKIKTTEAKAKAIKPMVDRIIVKAKQFSDAEKKVATIRELQKYLPKLAVEKLTGEMLKRFEGRQSGFARIIKLEKRKSDGAAVVILELV